MNIDKYIHCFAYACGLGASDLGCAKGPSVIMNHKAISNELPDVQWYELAIAQPSSKFAPQRTDLQKIADLCQRLAAKTEIATLAEEAFMVFGGDHSCAIGTWSGVQHALAPRGPLGLIWIDAHLDSHTFETTESGKIHGMPVAALLGYGDPALTQIQNSDPKILPQHLCLIGVRSFEKEEAELIKRLGVRVFYMDEVRQRGMKQVLQEAISIASNGTAGFGLSIDMDGVDPLDAPGVGSPVAGGISGNELRKALTLFHDDKRLVGIEIAEFNPHHDKEHKTLALIEQMVLAITKGKHYESIN